MRQLLFGLAAIGLLGLVWAADGQTLYQQNCAACHQTNAQGIPGAFPPLAGNPKVQDEAYVLKVVKQGLSGSIEVNGQKYNSAMPALPQVSEADTQAIASYLKGLGGASQAATEAAPVATPAGDASRGRALFIGQLPFTSGGSPCMACHSAGNLGLIGGGNLGKDKTDLYTRLGEAGIQGVLSNISFPVMREAFKNRPLTPEEISNLTAFFAQVAKEPPRPAYADNLRLLYAGVGGALLLFIILNLFWVNRREGLAEKIRGMRRVK